MRFVGHLGMSSSIVQGSAVRVSVRVCIIRRTPVRCIRVAIKYMNFDRLIITLTLTLIVDNDC